MIVAGIPVKDKNSASCRIRFYGFMKHLPKDFKWKKYDGTTLYDVLYIQKLVRNWTIKAAKKAKKAGKPVVFDLDDYRINWKDKEYDRLLKYVDRITTDTPLRKAGLSERCSNKIITIPDVIDYGVSPDQRILIKEKIQTVCTYGRPLSVSQASTYFDRIQKQCHYISGEKIKELSSYKMVPWNRKTFIKTLRQYDLAIIVHHKDDKHAFMKSNNRLLVAMSIGLPCIVSDTPAYRKTMEEVGLPWLVMKDERDLPRIMERIELPATRMEIQFRFQQYAFKNYSPVKSSEKLAEVFRSLL